MNVCIGVSFLVHRISWWELEHQNPRYGKTKKKVLKTLRYRGKVAFCGFLNAKSLFPGLKPNSSLAAYKMRDGSISLSLLMLSSLLLLCRPLKIPIISSSIFTSLKREAFSRPSQEFITFFQVKWESLLEYISGHTYHHTLLHHREFSYVTCMELIHPPCHHSRASSLSS